MTGMLDAFSSPIVPRLAWTLLHFLWQGAILALVAFALMASMRRAAASARYAAMLAVLAMMVVCPVLTFALLSRTSVPVDRAAPALVTQPRPAAAAPPASVAPVLVESPEVVSTIAPERVSSPPRLPRSPRPVAAGPDNRLALVVLAWLAGVCLLSLRLVAGWIGAERARRRRVRPVSDRLQETLAGLLQRMRISRPVQLMESGIAQVPSVVGWLRPVVLLPASALVGLTPAQLEAILAHELAHIRRHDYLVNLLQTLAETWLFYHPAVWWVSGRIRAEREHCCDDLAVAACGDAVGYLRALATLEQLRGLPEPALGVGGGPLLQRVRRLAGTAHARPNHRPAWLAGAVALVALAAIAMGMQACRTAGPTTASPARAYDRFLFAAGGRNGTQHEREVALLMARVSRYRITTSEVRPLSDFGPEPVFLGVFAGQLYWIQNDRLRRLDLATGRRVVVSESAAWWSDPADGRLFTAEGKHALREYDLRAGAYRDVATLPNSIPLFRWSKGLSPDGTIPPRPLGPSRLQTSPDGKRLAFYAWVPTKISADGKAISFFGGTPYSQLHVVDVATGAMTDVGSPFRFRPSRSSPSLEGPPFVWLNEKEVLFLRTHEYLATIDVETGDVRDVVTIPEELRFRVSLLTPPTVASPPILVVSGYRWMPPATTRYAVDVRKRTLTALQPDRRIGGDFRLDTGGGLGGKLDRLFHGTTLLSWQQTGADSADVSPDGTCARWTEAQPRRLRYYDAQTGRTLSTALKMRGPELQRRGSLWFSSEDLKPASTRLAPGWKRMPELAEDQRATSVPPSVPTAVEEPAGPKAMITVKGTAYAGMPVWVYVTFPKAFGLQGLNLRYPFAVYPSFMWGHDFEVTRDGRPLPRREAFYLHELTLNGPGGGSSAPPHAPKGRLPLHVLYALDKPGRYRFRYLLYEDKSASLRYFKEGVVWHKSDGTTERAGDRSPLLTSRWMDLVVKPLSLEQRRAWQRAQLAHPPTDPGLLAGDYLPSLLASPESAVLPAFLDALYHPDTVVQGFAYQSLRYFGEDTARRELPNLIMKRGPTPLLAEALSRDRVAFQPMGAALVGAIIPYLRSKSPMTAEGAIRALEVLGRGYQWQAHPDMPKRTERAVLAAVPRLRSLHDPGVLNALSSFFGGVKSAESRALLWEIAKTPKARVSAANALCRIGDPRDLPRLAQLLQIKDWMLSNLPGALNRAYGEKARPYLQKAAKSAPDPAVRRGAARTLAEMDKAKSRANTAPPPTGR